VPAPRDIKSAGKYNGTSKFVVGGARHCRIGRSPCVMTDLGKLSFVRLAALRMKEELQHEYSHTRILETGFGPEGTPWALSANSEVHH